MLLVEIIICFAMLVEGGISSPIQSNYAERPLRSYEKYLTNCAKKLFPLCGEEIFFSVFIGNQTVSNTCCLLLVQEIGHRCHDDMTRYILESPKYKANKVSIWQRSEKVWNGCVSVFHHISPI
jgi:hypothetical protein